MTEEDPWEPIESKLVLYTIVIGVICLIVLGVAVHMAVLSKYTSMITSYFSITGKLSNLISLLGGG